MAAQQSHWTEPWALRLRTTVEDERSAAAAEAAMRGEAMAEELVDWAAGRLSDFLF